MDYVFGRANLEPIGPMGKYPVFVMCGRDPERRRIMEALDPEGKYEVKALLPFLGKRVIDWQLEALGQCPYVEPLYLIGLNEADVQLDHPVRYVPIETTADFPDKLAAGLEVLRSEGRAGEMIVVSSSDAPAVTAESVNEFFEHLERLRGYDFVLSLVPEDVTEKEIRGQGGWWGGSVITRYTLRNCTHSAPGQ